MGVAATLKGKSEGGWDSIHVFESIDRGRLAHYKLTSTVILRLSTSNEGLGDMDLSGNMTRQIEQDMPVTDDASHVVNVGKLVEDMELKMRNLLRASHLTLVPQLCFSSHYSGPKLLQWLCADHTQRKCTSEKPRMWSGTFGVR